MWVCSTLGIGTSFRSRCYFSRQKCGFFLLPVQRTGTFPLDDNMRNQQKAAELMFSMNNIYKQAWLGWKLLFVQIQFTKMAF
jgi:hypothetical protein